MRLDDQNRHRLAAAACLCLLGSLAACSGDGASTASAPDSSASPTPPAATETTSGAPTDTATPPLPTGDEPVDLDAAEFTAVSDHPYFPLEPRQQWTYREVDESGATLRVVVTVTTQTRKIANGVVARVVRDTVTEEGELIEDTFDWYAQDAAGNVWYLGEETAEFENGRLTTRKGSFEAGRDGALPGIIMPADPAPGMSYRQEYYEGKAEDNGAILSVDQQADVRAGHFDDAVLTADTITLEPDVLEYKLYSRGVGQVLALGISGGAGREELVSSRRVSAALAREAGTAPLGTSYS